MITNIHHDAYGPEYETPMQGPFTEEHVGGNQHRHAPLNNAPSGALDTISTRAEAWSFTDVDGTDEMSLYAPISGSAFGYRPRARYYREELAKRPVNIRNIQTKTGSFHVAASASITVRANTAGHTIHLTGSGNDYLFTSVNDSTPPVNEFHIGSSVNDCATNLATIINTSASTDFRANAINSIIHVTSSVNSIFGNSDELSSSATTVFDITGSVSLVNGGLSGTFIGGRNRTLNILGNYHQSHEIVMTTGRKENNRFFAEASGDLLTASNEVYFFSGALEYTLPRRDLTGSNKFVIVNRFSAPGDPSTMGEGFLDVASGEYSVYNAMPWRNLDVRKPLQELLTDHVSKGGFFSDWFRLRSYDGTGHTYPGGTGSIDGSDYIGTGSFHKNHRNNILQLRYSDHYTHGGLVNATSSYDNYYVRHQIPRSDLQYAWITGSVVSSDNSTYTGSVVYGFEKPNFANASYASTDLIFVSASDAVSYLDTAASPNQRRFSVDKKSAVSNTSNYIPVDFVNGNTVIIDPVTSSTNILGVPEFLSNIVDAGDPNTYSASYVNLKFHAGGFVDFWGPSEEGASKPGMASILNGLLLNRGGPWGGANWKLYRKDSHPIVRAHRNENRISFVTSSKESISFVKVDPRNNELVEGRYWRTIVGFTSSIEPPINSKHFPIKFDLDIQTSIDGGETTVTFDQSYLNNFVKFSDKVDNLYDLNNAQGFDVVEGYPEKKLAYNTLTTLIVDDSISEKTNPINKVNSIITRETIYPREKNTYLANTRKRKNLGTILEIHARAEKFRWQQRSIFIRVAFI